MPTTRIDIRPKMVIWAIERAGYTLDTFMEKYPKSAVFDWLEGGKQPTVKQLQAFSQKVHIPFGYLFLPQPPNEQLPFPLFRTGKHPTRATSLNVYETVLEIKKRQEWLSEYLQEEQEPPLPFVGKFAVETSFEAIVADIRSVLDLPEEWAEYLSGKQESINFITEKIEEAGIIVTFNGSVGNNNKRRIEVDECRGFVLVDAYAPFIFVNNGDAKSAQLFTLAHEIAHIWLGQSAGFNNHQMQPADDPMERLCDKIAAELLVPQGLFEQYWEENISFEKLAKKFKVSPIVIARKALDMGKITKNDFFSFYNKYMEAFRNEQGTGGDFYRTAKKRTSLRFAALVNQAVQAGKLLYADAYKLTNLKGDTYHKFMNDHFYQEA